MAPLVIAARFNGPPGSANGGFAAGALASVLGLEAGQPVEVTLRAPPPLDTPLALEPGPPLRARHGETTVLEGRAAEALDLDVPSPPSFAAATAAAQHYAGHTAHIFPRCFTCGPDRDPGDGLRVFPGRAAAGAPVAAPLEAPADLYGPDDRLPEPVLWAALDCPGYFAAADGDAALLGRIVGEVHGTLRRGERGIVLGWSLGREGRKVFAGTAVFRESGELLARAKQTWILLRPSP
ncbi:MAG: hypothetical protein AAF447_06235 [Myxococcota bacterium]